MLCYQGLNIVFDINNGSVANYGEKNIRRQLAHKDGMQMPPTAFVIIVLAAYSGVASVVDETLS